MDDTPRIPVHRQPRMILLVGLGGTLGTAAREALSLAVPTISGIPWTILAINLAGALLLGMLLEALLRRGPDVGARRRLRLLLGTGFLGGFTTYSALAADAAGLFGSGTAAAGVAYGVGTVVVGAVATLVGMMLGVALGRARGDAS